MANISATYLLSFTLSPFIDLSLISATVLQLPQFLYYFSLRDFWEMSFHLASQ